MRKMITHKGHEIREMILMTIRTTHLERQTIMVSLYSEKRSTRVPAHVPMDTSILRVTPY